MSEDRPSIGSAVNLTTAQVEALFWFPSREHPEAIDKDAIEQLIGMGILFRNQAGEPELTDSGRSVYLELVMSREG